MPDQVTHTPENDAPLLAEIGAICPRGHGEESGHITPSGKRVCIPCRQLRKKRKEDRRDGKWPFVEVLPSEVGYNLGHHRMRPGDEHTTGEGCHCLPGRIPHEGSDR